MKRTGLLSILLCLPLLIWAKESKKSNEVERIVCYNCENAFDTWHDTLKNDLDFTPDGLYRWTRKKYEKKIEHIAKAVIAAGEWKKPIIVGLCEIENKRVLSDLIKKTSLSAYGYRYVHQESMDERGVDVALLYNPEKVKIIETQFIRAYIAERPTRDVLRAKCLLANNDTIHVFVNHWPSKYGGEKESEQKRIAVASALRSVTDSILRSNPNANLLIMGDMNEGMDEQAVSEKLGASLTDKANPKSGLINLSAKYKNEVWHGTHFFANEWHILDQIIASAGMSDTTSKTFTSKSRIGICESEFLMTKTKRGDLRPYRSFKGTFYAGGYSDHLPVWADIEMRK